MNDPRTHLTALYTAFNQRDIPTLLAAMTPDVRWPNGWEGGHVHGREAVNDYWTRQWAEIDPHVEPRAFATEPDGRVAVTVHQTVRDKTGATVLDETVTHVYHFDDGLVDEMEIR